MSAGVFRLLEHSRASECGVARTDAAEWNEGGPETFELYSEHLDAMNACEGAPDAADKASWFATQPPATALASCTEHDSLIRVLL